jgi:hypothetical protein
MLTVWCNGDQFLRKRRWNARLQNLSLSMSNEIERLMIIQLECYLNAVADMKEYSVRRIFMTQVQCMAEHGTYHLCFMSEVHFQSSYQLHGLYFHVNYTSCKKRNLRFPFLIPRQMYYIFLRLLLVFDRILDS